MEKEGNKEKRSIGKKMSGRRKGADKKKNIMGNKRKK